MNTIATIPTSITPAPVTPPYRTPPLLPADLNQAMKLAEWMARGKLVPAHLQGSVADCLSVIMQAVRWQCDPFAVAQCTSLISGKLMFEGKLTAAVINTSGKLKGRLHFDFTGEGDAREVICSGHIIGEPEPASVTVKLKDAKTNNRMWTVQSDQQLCYHSARVWARRYMPEIMLGIYAAEEFPEPQAEAPREAIQRTIDETKQTPLIELKMPSGTTASFPKTKAGITEALRFMSENAAAVMLNLDLLDTIAERMPAFADRVAEVRSAAAKALKPVEPEGDVDDWSQDGSEPDAAE